MVSINVPARPSDLGIVIEGDRWWEYQQDAIGQIAESFRGGTKFVLADMPTGSGKTIVATAVQKLLGLTAVNLTHTIQLQEQYTKTMDWATIVKGRQNYPCGLERESREYLEIHKKVLTADVAPCASENYNCPHILVDRCGYYDMLHKAASNDQVVMNYAYATRILQASRLRGVVVGDGSGDQNPFHRELLVCDEGDLAEGAIISSIQIHPTRSLWDGVDTNPPWDSADSVDAWYDWASIPLGKRLEEEANSLLAEISAVKEQDGDDPIPTHLTEEYSKARQRLRQVETIPATVSSDTWIARPEEYRGKVSGALLQPIWGRSVANGVLWMYFNHVLLMSGTLGDPEDLKFRLGIPEDNSRYLSFPSSFPVENRPLYYWPIMKVNRNSTDDDFGVLAKAVVQLANYAGLDSRKGLVHTGSFKVAERLYKFLSMEPRFMIHRGNRMEALARFKASARGIFLTPSFTTGLDLPGEIGWQAIVKMPFGDLGDPIVRARREDGDHGKRSYDAEAMNTVVQAYGRAVRTPTDKGVTFVLDSNFWPLYKRAYTPSHFKEAVVWLNRKQ